jgi:hypothetical protein
VSRETETACWAAQDCRLDPNCADYGYQCAATAAREAQIRAEERAKVAEEIAAAIEERERGLFGDDWHNGYDSLREAARVVREIGGRDA